MSGLRFLGWGVFSILLTITFVLLIINLALSHTAWRKDREMPKLRFLNWKTLSIFLTIILIPFIINLISNYTTWRGTRGRVEITLRLNDCETVGMLLDGELEDLKLTCGDIPVKNAIKVSWQVMNTGSTGISEFETLPAIVLPDGLNVANAKISGTSPLLKIDRDVSIDPEHGVISINSLGVFNPGDFFEIGIYITDIPDAVTSSDYFDDWHLVAKSVDLRIKRDLECENGYGLRLVQYP